MPHQLMYFEGLNGVAQDRVCRGANIYDNKRCLESKSSEVRGGCRDVCVCVMNGALGMDMDAEEGGDCDVCEVSPAAEETQVAASV